MGAGERGLARIGDSETRRRLGGASDDCWWEGFGESWPGHASFPRSFAAPTARSPQRRPLSPLFSGSGVYQEESVSARCRSRVGLPALIGIALAGIRA
jgi:hypothetical protein